MLASATRQPTGRYASMWCSWAPPCRPVLGKPTRGSVGRRPDTSDAWCQVDLRTASGAGTTQTPGTSSSDTLDDSLHDSDETSKDWEALGAVEDVMTVQHQAGKRPRADQMVEIAVDSGAAEAVAPPTFAADYKIRPPQGQRNCARYRTASGNTIAKRIQYHDEGGRWRP